MFKRVTVCMVQVAAVVVALDRQETRDEVGTLSAIEVLSEECGVQVISVLKLNDLITYVQSKPVRHNISSKNAIVHSLCPKLGMIRTGI